MFKDGGVGGGDEIVMAGSISVSEVEIEEEDNP